MRTVRLVILWVVLAAIATLAVLSVAGALLSTELGAKAGPYLAFLLGPGLRDADGAARAKAFFNSLPMVVFWFFLAMLFLAGAAFPRLLRSPSAVAMHAGCLLIILGAMWGSEKAHSLRQTLGSKKVASGFMIIEEGQTASGIIDGRTQRKVAELPFGVRLRDFSVEYYPSRQTSWRLLVVVPQLDAQGNVVDEFQSSLPCKPGEAIEVPHTPVRLRVLEYFESALPVYDGGADPFVEITTPAGTSRVPARQGQEADVTQPPMKVRVGRVFQNMVVEGTGPQRRVSDAPHEGSNPAVEVEIIQPDGTSRKRYLMAFLPMHGQTRDGLAMRYVIPQPTGARPDASSGVPAMHVLLMCEGREQRAWLMPEKGERFARFSLGPILAGRSVEDPEADQNAPALFLVAPMAEVSDYKSDLEVIENGKTVARKVIEVNHPLRWGGYHFYQHSYDSRNHQYTVLAVVSDSGLVTVYVGFVLLAGGALVRFWVGPAVRWLARRSGPEQDAARQA